MVWGMNFYINAMHKLYVMLAAIALLSCEEKEAAKDKAILEKTVDSYGALIEKAKETESILQKKADSIVHEQNELGIPR